MSYQALKWVDRDKSKDIPGTKLNAENLNHIEAGIVTLDNAVADLTKAFTGLNLTEDQIKALSDISGNVAALQKGLDALQAKFDAHVHSNEAGNTTGGVTTDPTATTSTTDSSSTNG
ncbi:hypothetical protein B0P06_006098 [Clostridium saccharoperbutylacetonicum]|jgi:hypothetical protein|uniref:Uncharacterized protein n=1 Tax=Clostridium saccharoperbutylacetonicum N1-4(HMT) TaxID=931276 RepID=M1N8G7_9CLOT|nr:hypothetical protein [Clostridium saccharoperbutylacetonicum]AGF59627.1 hypothetical protein Cspa_135p00670 [Clostridium saccharoperbutylacetonicum N1-4(HMT)]NRT64516.1 hypothetical protein [Clostridium saccharoperbutylacetonicum]NSB28991.1 hypothetical protein [Clostridium saccharoperbutylacetonicum]NSB46205.1 hypothetical protein [Clostridium saccharoperbutylacetonicum]